MGDWVKIAVKTALVATITVAIVAVFATVQLPSVNVSDLVPYLQKGYAIAVHWCPVLGVIYPVAIALMGLRIAIWGVHFGLMAVRWIMKVNE